MASISGNFDVLPGTPGQELMSIYSIAATNGIFSGTLGVNGSTSLAAMSATSITTPTVTLPQTTLTSATSSIPTVQGGSNVPLNAFRIRTADTTNTAARMSIANTAMANSYYDSGFTMYNLGSSETSTNYERLSFGINSSGGYLNYLYGGTGVARTFNLYSGSVFTTGGALQLANTLGVTGTSTLAALNATNASLSGTLGVTGTSTLAALNATNTSLSGTLGVTGTSTLAALNATNASLSGTLGVTGTSTLAALNATNASLSGTLGVTGASTLAALNATNASLSGTLGVTGASTLAALNATNASLSGTLGVTGTSTLAALNATNASLSGTLGVTGASTLAALNATNASLSGTLGVTGTSNLATINGTALTTTGTNTFSGILDCNNTADATSLTSASSISTAGGISIGLTAWMKNSVVTTPYYAMWYTNSTQTITKTTITNMAVGWTSWAQSDTKMTNAFSGTSGTTNVFTVPYTGLYSLQANIRMTPTSATAGISEAWFNCTNSSIYGTTAIRLGHCGVYSALQNVAVVPVAHFIGYFNTGDQVNIAVYNAQVNVTLTSGSDVTFGVVLLQRSA